MDFLQMVTSMGTVGLVLTGAASSWAAVLAVRATERLEQLTGTEAAALAAMVHVQFTGRIDNSTPVPRLVMVSNGAAVVVHGADLGSIDARTAGGAAHPGPHAHPGPLRTAHELPRRLHRGEALEFDWPGGVAEREACRSYGPESRAVVTAQYSLGQAGPVECRVVPVELSA